MFRAVTRRDDLLLLKNAHMNNVLRAEHLVYNVKKRALTILRFPHTAARPTCAV